jgi:phosphoglycerate-specific signal transduction histidine kinase
MQKVKSIQAINSAILGLEQKKEAQRDAIKTEIDNIHQSLIPGNIIKRSIEKITSSGDLTKRMVSSSLIIGSGFVVKKIISGKSKNSFRKLFGTIAQVAATGLVAKNANKIVFNSAELGKKLFHSNK